MPGRTRRLAGCLSLAVVTAIGALCVPAAGAATVTVGSPMNAGSPFSETETGGPLTLANIALGEPGAIVTSPVTGTIVRWRITTTGTGQYSLRVLRPVGSAQYTAVGTDPQTVSSAGAQTFSSSLPMQAGDLLGVDIPANGGIAGVQAPGSNWALWSGSVGSSPAMPANQAHNGFELYLNADVEYTPTPDRVPASPESSPKKCERKKSEEKSKRRKHKRSARAAKSKCKRKKN